MKIDLLIESIDKKPSQGKMLLQNITASVAPNMAAYSYLREPIKNSLIGHGISGDSLIKGVEGFSKADLLSNFGTSLLGIAGSALAIKGLNKYRKHKYGIEEPKNKTNLTDTALNIGQTATGITNRALTAAGLATALGPAHAAMVAHPIFIPTYLATSYLANKPITKLRQHLQKKRSENETIQRNFSQ